MKRRATFIVIMAAMLVFSACSNKDKDKDKENTSSISSSSAISSETSSKSNDLFPNSSQPEVSLPTTSSEDETKPTVATPIQVDGITINDVSQLENKKKGWGQGKQVDKANRPLTCNEYQVKYAEYDAMFIMPDDEKKMYLTFDEGYENGYTATILDTLKEKNCPAVFFLTMPYVKQNPELIKRMIDEGHVVGNHSVHHKSTPTLTVEEQVKEIVELHNYIVENFNYQMTLFRPPMGEWSTQTLSVTKQLGYKTVFWSYAYLDYDVNNQMGVAKAFPRVTNAAHNGAIYLLHAVSKDNTEMLGDVVDTFREKGYSLEKLQ
ncbi:MAG: polysaccharide deacetylase family protein [Oscillospiraceae bacterium]